MNRIEGFRFEVIEQTTTGCTVESQRPGQKEPFRTTFTMEDAKRANLLGSPTWRAYPKNMLFAHAPGVARGIVTHIDRGQGSVYLPWFWAPIMEVVRRLPEPIFQRLGFLSDR